MTFPRIRENKTGNGDIQARSYCRAGDGGTPLFKMCTRRDREKESEGEKGDHERGEFGERCCEISHKVSEEWKLEYLFPIYT